MTALHIHGLGACAVGFDEDIPEVGLGRLDDVPIKPLTKPAVRRRYGRVTKLSYVAAHRAIQDAAVDDPRALDVVTGTVMGEVAVSLELLSQIHARRGVTLSPSLIPNSVHNAPAGHLTIGLGNRRPAVTVSQGWLTGEAAIAAAADLLELTGNDRVLVVFGDEADPAWVGSLEEAGMDELAKSLGSERFQEGAVAMVLGRAPGGANLGTIEAGLERDPDRRADRIIDRLCASPAKCEIVLDERVAPFGRDLQVTSVRHRVEGAPQIGAASLLLSRVRDPNGPDRLLTISSELDEVAWIDWRRR